MPRPPLPVGSWGKINLRAVKDGHWRARTRYRGDDGHTRQVEAWGRTRAGAEQAIRENLATRVERTGTTINSETRLEDLARFWLQTEVEGSDRASNTRKRYKEIVEKRIIPGIGGLLVREATVARLDAYVTSVAADSQSTANLCRSVLVGMFRLAVRHDARTSNPMREIRTIRSPAKDVRALTATEISELRRILYSDKKAARADLPAIVDVMLATGCRVGEALAIRWSDLDLGEGTVMLSGTIVRDDRLGLIRQDKTKGRKPRAMRLPPTIVTMLLARSIDGLPGGPLDLVFPTARLTPREVTTVNRQWRDFRGRHPQWEWVSSHVFRKSVGTEIERMQGIEAAAKVLGHASPQTTRKHYVATPDLGPDVSGILAGLVLPLDESAG
ncbi:tyrosine-type recombinase/integrase [Demequina aurantiaca]|uniref:tyrosine-type recombinase/integrase n=1 Tax=Demequina aurantiaca TaxID=676200 RepID=UPI003D3322A6